jgi:hypothetical protein
MATDGAAATARLLRQRLSGVVWLPVEGDSMRPTIRGPAEVHVVARDRPRIGEVWAFVGPAGRVVVHRCERRTAQGYVFHGDGRAPPDPVTPPALLVGRAVAVRGDGRERRLGSADRVRGLARQTWRRVRQRWPVPPR